PLFPCLGNHEEDSPLFFEHFRFPANGSGQGHGRWYSFDAGPAHFVALDVVFSDTEPGSAQYRWLDQDLAQTDRRWKFVYFHYPPYNASPHHRSNLRLRTALEPLFLRHKVSAVFNGHGHLYERAYGASAAPNAPPMLWIVSGGGGGVPQPPGREAFTQYTEVTFHFLRVQIRGERLSITGVRPDGSEFDRFEARLKSDGRLEPLTESPVVSGPVVRQPGAIDFLTSPRGAIVAGYQAVASLAAPLGLSVALPSRRRRVVPVPSGPDYTPLPRPDDPYADWRGLPVVGTVAGAIALLLLVLLPTAPLQWLIGFDAYSITLSLHAAAGTFMLLAASTAAALGYRLAIHRAPSLGWVFGSVTCTAVCAVLAVALGDALYAQYIKSGGPMDELVRKASDAHTVLFEFKMRVGLLPLPLSGAAAFIVWRYRGDLRRDRHLAELMALLFALLVFFVLTPYALGAAVTRLRGLL
ncbi:MAG TPA: metallophosphoesterase, partial [Chloroflexota bacterium]|nr:metallophosphoesterase [Chloroflexota bacterium]